MLGLSRYWQLLAIEVQISEYLRELPFAPPINSLCLSYLERMLELLKILWSVVLGWMLVLFMWALSMICLVKLVRMISGWFLGRYGIFRIAVVREN